MANATSVILECDKDLSEEARIARVAAEFVGACLFHRHRGALSCDDRFVIFGNDGYITDPRSRREVEIVLDNLSEDEPVLGIDQEGCSWAVVVTDFSREKFDEDELNDMVWDAWMLACDEAMAEKAKK